MLESYNGQYILKTSKMNSINGAGGSMINGKKFFKFPQSNWSTIGSAIKFDRNIFLFCQLLFKDGKSSILACGRICSTGKTSWRVFCFITLVIWKWKMGSSVIFSFITQNNKCRGIVQEWCKSHQTDFLRHFPNPNWLLSGTFLN